MPPPAAEFCPHGHGTVRVNPVRQPNSNGLAGRVEVCVEDQWHSLCARINGSSIWDSHTAVVFCKEWTENNRVANASKRGH